MPCRTFHVLAGDAESRRHGGLLDFNILAQNFGQSPRIFSQGDFTYNGAVDLLDFNVLAQNFGISVGPSVFSANEDHRRRQARSRRTR
jgi:hypothetical protein